MNKKEDTVWRDSQLDLVKKRNLQSSHLATEPSGLKYKTRPESNIIIKENSKLKLVKICQFIFFISF
jgi:hypothetical protein